MNARRLALCALAACLAACGPRERAVKIAVAAPLTGDLGTEGQGLLRAVELAVEQADASGRFPYRIAVEPFDDRSEPEEAANVADLIIADQRAVAVVGPYSSGCALRASRVYAQGPIAMITPSATNPEVTAQQLKADWPGPKVVFRVCPTDDVQGGFAARFVFHKLGRRRVAVIHDKSPYGDGLASRFAQTFKAMGGKVIADQGITPSTKNFDAVLSGLKNASPDGVFFAGVYTEAGLVLQALRGRGLKVPFVGGDGANTPTLFDVAGDAAEGAYLAELGKPLSSSLQAEKFAQDYRRRWAGPDEGLRPFDAYGYDAAQIVLDGLEKIGPENRYDRVKLISALAKTRHEGVAGLTVFDEQGDSTNKSVTMTRARAADRSFAAVK